MEFTSTAADLSTDEWSFSYFTEKLEIIGRYDRGTAEIGEDSAAMRLPFIALADGTSGVYLPTDGPKMYGNRSGGQIASQSLIDTINEASPHDTIEDVLAIAIAKCRQHFGNEPPEVVGGATGVVLKLDESNLKIAQWGDAYIIIERADGSIFISEDQVRPHDIEMRNKIRELMDKHNGDRSKMWEEFRPYLLQMRAKRVNSEDDKSYGMLNHQDEFLKKVRMNSFSAFRQILVATDGLFPFDELENSESFAKNLIERLNSGTTLRELLEARKNVSLKESSRSHITVPEATGILIKVAE